mgnify:FL=1
MQICQTTPTIKRAATLQICGETLIGATLCYHQYFVKHFKFNDMISINDAKQIREQFGFTHIVILGIDKEGKQNVATHGKSKANAKQAADMGNHLKKELHWPVQNCNAKPLERICSHCDFWQRGYHRPGDVIQENQNGKCMFNPEPILRYEKDIACGQFLPVV